MRIRLFLIFVFLCAAALLWPGDPWVVSHGWGWASVPVSIWWVSGWLFLMMVVLVAMYVTEDD